MAPNQRRFRSWEAEKKILGVLNKQQNFQEEEKERKKFPTYISDPPLSPVDLSQPFHVLLAHDWNEILEGFHFIREVSRGVVIPLAAEAEVLGVAREAVVATPLDVEGSEVEAFWGKEKVLFKNF